MSQEVEEQSVVGHNVPLECHEEQSVGLRHDDGGNNVSLEEQSVCGDPLECQIPKTSNSTEEEYKFLTFLVHKPIGVISSTIDNAPVGMRRDGNNDPLECRKTIWKVAEESGFPSNIGLVGRLDCETSGIIMFTNDTKLADAIRDPPDEGSILWQSPYKTKEYELTLLSSKPYEEHEPFDIHAFAKEVSQPLTFQKENIVYHCNEAEVTVLRRYRDESRSRGRSNLGWIIELRVILREGKHHQIRRLAHRAGYHIVSLHRRTIAGTNHKRQGLESLITNPIMTLFPS